MTPIEIAARNLVRQDYYRHGHQPSGAVESYVDAEWPSRIDDARAVLEAVTRPSESMVDAAVVEAHAAGTSIRPHEIEGIYRVMIEASLAEG